MTRRHVPEQAAVDAFAVVGVATVLTAVVGGLVWTAMTVEAWLRTRRTQVGMP